MGCLSSKKPIDKVNYSPPPSPPSSPLPLLKKYNTKREREIQKIYDQENEKLRSRRRKCSNKSEHPIR